jgi:hypothetical protein
MKVLNPRDVSLLALLANERRANKQTIKGSPVLRQLKSGAAQEIARAILGRSTRSQAAKKTARSIVKWASGKQTIAKKAR